MPKSKNRKGHDKKSKERTFQIRKSREKAQKELMELFQKEQIEKLEQQKDAAEKDTSSIVENVDIGDISDLQIEEEPKAIEPEIIENSTIDVGDAVKEIPEEKPKETKKISKFIQQKEMKEKKKIDRKEKWAGLYKLVE